MQDKSKAVVFIGCGYPMGGVLFLAHMGVEIYRKQENLDADFFFAAIKGESQFGFWRIVHEMIPASRIVAASTFDEVSRMIVALARRYSKVVVHTAGGWGQTKQIIAAKWRHRRDESRRIVLVGTTHSYRNDSWLRIPMSIFQYMMYRLFYRMVVFQCDYAVNRFVGGRRLIQDKRACVIPLGCETFDSFSLAAPQGGICPRVQKALSDSSVFKFVYLAEFRPGKNHRWLVTSLAPVLKSHPSSMLLLCGTGNRKMVENVVKCIHLNGVTSQVIMAGFVNRTAIPYVLSHCDCAIVPSGSETFGHNFLEPMFAKIPVLGTAVGVGVEIIQNHRTGFTISLNKVKEFRYRASFMIENREVVRKMGENAFMMVSDKYSHANVAARHVELYNQLLKEG